MEHAKQMVQEKDHLIYRFTIHGTGIVHVD